MGQWRHNGIANYRDLIFSIFESKISQTEKETRMELLTDNQKELLDFPILRERLVSPSCSDSGLDIIVKPSDHKVLGIVPENQYILPHAAAYEKVKFSLEEANINAKVSTFQLLRNGARFFTHFRIGDAIIDVGKDGKEDLLYPEIILRNAYDGDFTFGLEWGIWRQICTNGARALILGDKVTRKMLMGDTDVAVMVSQVKDFVKIGLPKLGDRIKEMQEPITDASAARDIVEEVQHFIEPHFSNKLQERFGGVLNESMNEPVNEWNLFNAVTNVATHDVRSYGRRRQIELAAARRFHFESFINNN